MEAIKSGEMTQRQAADRFKIPRSTIKNKLKNLFSSTPGHPKVFNEEEELSLASHIDKMCEFGFPIDELDLRFIVKNYVTRQGKKITCFSDNLPGRDWAKSFLKRHPQLTVKFSSNIKRNRAQIDEKILSDYFEQLNEELNGVPPQNVYNYDETCMSDDPGRKKVICRRGSKYPERIMNSTKTNISVMFCGNANGDSVPPYIIYKAEHLWTTWTEGGPEGARYNRTKQGWIDGATFDDWFSAHLLPILKKQEGKKVVIGDNLSSHVSLNVVKLCEANDIHFVCLPPNSSHLTQPLDVAYFRPLKMKWRQILTQWKQSESGKTVSTMPKDIFPQLLKKCLDELEPNIKENLKSGFRKAGIYPIDKDEVLKRLPTTNASVNLELVGESFIHHLQQKRKEVVKPRLTKRQKLEVPSGKSITAIDIIQYEEGKKKQKEEKKREKEMEKEKKKKEKEKEKQEKIRQRYLEKKRKPQGKTLKRKKAKQIDLSSTDEESDYSVISSGHSDMIFSSEDEEELDSVIGPQDVNPVASTSSNVERTSAKDNLETSLQVGNFVVVQWNELKFPGIAVEITDEGAVVECMERTSKLWKWPTVKDSLFYKWCDIHKIIQPPKLMKRGLFSVSNL